MAGLFSRLAQRAVAPQSVPWPSQRSHGNGELHAHEALEPVLPRSEPAAPVRRQGLAPKAESSLLPLRAALSGPQPDVELPSPTVAPAMRDPTREPAPEAAVSRDEAVSAETAAHPADISAEFPQLPAPIMQRVIEQSLLPARSRVRDVEPRRRAAARDFPPEPAQPPVVNVTIDRVEVRMPAPERPASPAPRRSTSTRVSLEDYLARSARR